MRFHWNNIGLTCLMHIHENEILLVKCPTVCMECKTPVTLRRTCCCAGSTPGKSDNFGDFAQQALACGTIFWRRSPLSTGARQSFPCKTFFTTVTIFSPRRLLRTTCTLPEPLLIAHRFSPMPCRRQNMMVGRVSRARCSHAPWSGRAPVWLSTCALSAP